MWWWWAVHSCYHGAVYETGLEMDLTTLEQPNLTKLENIFGKVSASIMKKINSINLLNMFDEQTNYDLIINTHGDLDPYYDPSPNAKNMIVYCHYPSANLFIENDDMDYLKYHLKLIDYVLILYLIQKWDQIEYRIPIS